jgi:hypothetical protein
LATIRPEGEFLYEFARSKSSHDVRVYRAWTRSRNFRLMNWLNVPTRAADLVRLKVNRQSQLCRDHRLTLWTYHRL